MEVLQSVLNKRLEEINKSGGIGGKKLTVKYVDDEGTPQGARKAVTEALKDKHLVGFVGCWSSTRTMAFADLLADANMPLIGGYALTPLFQQYPNMYTAERSIKDVTSRFKMLVDNAYKRPAFLGKKNDLYSEAFLTALQQLERSDPDTKIVMAKWFESTHQFTEEELKSIYQDLQNADFIVISFGNILTSNLIEQLREAGIKQPVFTALGDLGFVITHTDAYTTGELFDLNVVDIPGTFNQRLQEQIPAFLANLQATSALEVQLSFAARFADSIGILADAAGTNQDEDSPLNERIIKGLEKYIGGERIYHGWYADWYFTKERAIAGDVLLAWKPPSLSRYMLAPNQYVRFQDSVLSIPVLYSHVDMVRIDRVSDTEGSFYANFYLEITSKEDIDINQLDFSNAARSSTNHQYLTDLKLLRKQRVFFKGMPMYNKMYEVSGKFLFTPDLKKYPFDRQKFPINIKPKSAVEPFLVQPTITEMHNTNFDVKGWNFKYQFVGYDHDIISFFDAFTDKQQNLPFYKFSYTYVMERAKADFFLKVLTPLLVILVVTYFSVFIPLHRFETLEAIQVTSLLASIALYFSAYKPEMEYATISDKIFIFTYIMITSLIGTSILRFVEQKKRTAENKLARIYQYYIFPLIVLVFTLLIVS